MIFFSEIAVVEKVAIEKHDVIGIDLGGYNLGFFQVAEADPAADAVPVLADFFAVIEFYFDLRDLN